MTFHSLIKGFQKPDNIFRAISFWALNGRLEAGELKRQLDCFREMGMAGACLHARTGLQTPYLSGEWFDLMRVCVAHAQKQKMIIWLYDEDRYPSGAAGGLVTRNAKHRQQRLLMEIEPEDTSGRRDWFALRGTPRKPTHYRRIDTPADRRKEEFIVSFRQREAQLNGWYNGYTYIDAMSPDAVRAFIQSTYEPYRRALGEHFGRTIEGFFTDEPCYGSTLSNWWGEFIDGYEEDERREIPWTHRLAQLFQKRFGYDLRDRLPELYWDITGNVSHARYHYHEQITTLLTECFCKTISRWCGKAGTQFMGHVLCEETPSSQTNVVGSAMRFYEHFHIGGVDMLGTKCRDYDTVIQAASVNRQMGRRWLLSEMQGATGWDFSLEGHKVMGDWQVALGVNRRCLHLAFYTMEGGRKRDYPGSISFQSAWWRQYARVEDYFARLTSVMSRGEAVCGVLVIHPVESTWLRCRQGWLQAADVAALDRRLARLRDWLLGERIAFDYGDETLLGRWGEVDGTTLRMNRAAYNVVVVPPMLTIRGSTLALLEKFQQAGGRVVWLGRPAVCVDGVPGDRTRDVARQGQRIAFTQKAVTDALGGDRVVRLTRRAGGEMVLCHLRREASRYYLFICNTDEKKGTGRMEVSLPVHGRVEQWNALTGERSGVKSRSQGKCVVFDCELPAGGSALFVVGQMAPLAVRETPWDRRKEPLPMARWDYALTEPNVLPIDWVRVRLGKGEWSDEMETLQADRWLREQLEWKPHSYFEVQPWAQAPANDRDRHPVEAEWTFEIDGPIPRQSWLALERVPGLESVAINGNTLNLDAPTGWWIDPCFGRYAVEPAWLAPGTNCVTARFAYEPLTGLENHYLLSGHGVSVKGRRAALVEAPATLRLESITTQGLPFYGAGVCYQRQVDITPKPGERVFLVLSQWAGSCVSVRMNGESIGEILWRPYEIELPVTQRGTYAIEIEVMLGRGNTLGPLHRNGPALTMSGPRDWETSGGQWSDAYRTSPAGLRGPVRLVYRR